MAVRFAFTLCAMFACCHTVPLYIDAFVGSQKVEAVEDSVAGNLDIIH